jgi:hypothetical protein
MRKDEWAPSLRKANNITKFSVQLSLEGAKKEQHPIKWPRDSEIPQGFRR